VCMWNQGGGGPKKFGNHCSKPQDSMNVDPSEKTHTLLHRRRKRQACTNLPVSCARRPCFRRTVKLILFICYMIKIRILRLRKLHKPIISKLSLTHFFFSPQLRTSQCLHDMQTRSFVSQLLIFHYFIFIYNNCRL
jgi:hypothetical protein